MTRLFSRAAVFSVVLSLACVVARAQQLSTKPLMNITGYVIDVTVIPSTHELHATAKVSFTALDMLPVATFELHSGLKVMKVADAKGHPLNAERGQASTLRVTPSQPMAKGVFVSPRSGWRSSKTSRTTIFALILHKDWMLSSAGMALANPIFLKRL